MIDFGRLWRDFFSRPWGDFPRIENLDPDHGRGFDAVVETRGRPWPPRKLRVETPRGSYTASQVKGEDLHIEVDVPGYAAEDLVASRDYDALVVRAKDAKKDDPPLVQVRLPAFADIAVGGMKVSVAKGKMRVLLRVLRVHPGPVAVPVVEG